MLAAVSSTFRRYGLKLNWRPGKSEILISLRGTGATKARGGQVSPGRRESHDVGSSVRSRWGSSRTDGESLCGPQVQTLGTWLTSDGSLTIEMKHRAASACGALVALERTVLGKRGCKSGDAVPVCPDTGDVTSPVQSACRTLRRTHCSTATRRALLPIAGAGWKTKESTSPVADSEVRETTGRTIHRVHADQGQTSVPGQGVQGDTTSRRCGPSWTRSAEVHIEARRRMCPATPGFNSSVPT